MMMYTLLPFGSYRKMSVGNRFNHFQESRRFQLSSYKSWKKIISTICRPKISPPKVIYKVQSMPYKSLPLGAFWTIFGRNFPTGVLQLLYPYQPANPLVESIFKALIFSKKHYIGFSIGPINFLFSFLGV